jgi:hypothetical protein
MTDFLTAPSPAPLDAPLNGLEQVIDAAMADPVHWRAFEDLMSAVDLFLAPDGETLAGIQPGATGMRTLRSDEPEYSPIRAACSRSGARTPCSSP